MCYRFMHSHTRRALLGASITAIGSGVLAACSGPGSHSGPGPHPASGSPSETDTRSGIRGPGHRDSGFVPKGPKGYVNPSDPEVVAAERERGSGPLRTFTLTA